MIFRMSWDFWNIDYPVGGEAGVYSPFVREKVNEHIVLKNEVIL